MVARLGPTSRPRPETKPGEAGLGGGDGSMVAMPAASPRARGRQIVERRSWAGALPRAEARPRSRRSARTLHLATGEGGGPWGNHGFPHGQTYVCWSRHVRHIATPHSTSTATNTSTWRRWAPPYQLTPRSATASSPAP